MGNNHLGVTIGIYNDHSLLDPQTFPDLAKLGVGWIRPQQNLDLINPSPSVYNWTVLDDTVKRANEAGISVDFPLRNPPARGQNPISCGTGPNGEVWHLPDAAYMAELGGVIANRYNGKNGHGLIAAMEVGNEDFTLRYTPPATGPQTCRDVKWFTPVLQATYPAIKKEHPDCLVGMGALLWSQLPHVYDFMAGIYAAGLKDFYDFANLHYYTGNDPMQSSLAAGETNGVRNIQPSFPLKWQTMASVMDINADSSKEIWCTEIGWPTNANPNRNPTDVVTEAVQASNYQVTLESARTSGRIKRYFAYTLRYDSEGDSLVQGSASAPRYLSAFGVIQQYAAVYPQWGEQAPLPPPSPPVVDSRIAKFEQIKVIMEMP